VTDLRSRYEDVERAVCSQVPFEISHVPDDVERRYDAELDQALPTSPPVARSATAGTPFELKTCQPRKASDGRPGQWIFHEKPHEFLKDEGGRYLLAVLDELELERWVVCGPRDLEHGLNWYDCPGTKGYQRQAHIEWPVVIGEVSWTSRGRLGRIPDDGGESA